MPLTSDGLRSGELNPVGFEVDCPGECLDEKGFSQTWNDAQQAVADGKKRRQDFLDRYPPPDDGAPRFVAQSTPQFVRHLQYRMAASG